MNDVNGWSLGELLNLPKRAWDAESEYDSLLVVSTGEQHDSGWAIMAIVGVRDRTPAEIACDCCDDIQWKASTPSPLSMMRTDCALGSGAVHFWGRGVKFRVGAALSSTTVEVIRQAAA